jgi:acyl-coenzyme A synthetase/AMP-(fatty) acid ligase
MGHPSSLLGRLAEHVRDRPDATALVFGEERVSYAELDAMAGTALAGIDELALPAGTVAVHAAKTPRTIALLVACLRARLPVLLPSAELGADMVSTLLRNAGCGDMLTAETPAQIADHRVHKIDCTVSPGTGGRSGRPPATSDGAADGDVALLLTTSGSTGVPKIVPLTVGAVDRFTDWAAAHFGIGQRTAVLNYAPLNFDLCLLDIWATLKAGGTAVLVETDRATNGRHLGELVRDGGVGVIQSVPMFFRLLNDSWDGEPFPSVGHVVLTGDKTSAKLLAELPRMFPAARIWNLYGCTETNDSLVHEIDPAAGGDLPVGRPLPGVDALVVDGDGNVASGPATGELFVRTPFQTDGYLDPAGTTANRFVHLEDGAGPYFRSGDLVRRDADGVFTLLGRDDFQVKVRGFRVNLEEIELIILEHDDVVEAAVIGVPDDVAGVRIHAVVRGRAPGTPNGLVLRDHCRRRLPRVAIPAAIQITQEPLPRTSTGKVDRQEIRRTALNRS